MSSVDTVELFGRVHRHAVLYMLPVVRFHFITCDHLHIYRNQDGLCWAEEATRPSRLDCLLEGINGLALPIPAYYVLTFS